LEKRISRAAHSRTLSTFFPGAFKIVGIGGLYRIDDHDPGAERGRMVD